MVWSFWTVQTCLKSIPMSRSELLIGNFGDSHNGRVERGWILVARSGQIYGLNGTAMVSGPFHENKVISDHIIRIAPRNPQCRWGTCLWR